MCGYWEEEDRYNEDRRQYSPWKSHHCVENWRQVRKEGKDGRGRPKGSKKNATMSGQHPLTRSVCYAEITQCDAWQLIDACVILIRANRKLNFRVRKLRFDRQTKMEMIFWYDVRIYTGRNSLSTFTAFILKISSFTGEFLSFLLSGNLFFFVVWVQTRQY